MVGKVVVKTVATVQDKVMLYKAVVQLVFLYGSDSWVLTGDMLKVLEVFHNHITGRIAGMRVQHTTSR